MQNLYLIQPNIEYDRTKRVSSKLKEKIEQETKKGALINNFVKDSINAKQEDLNNNLLKNYVVPSNISMPKDSIEKPKEKKEKSPLKNLCLGTLGLLGGITLLSYGASKVADKKFQRPNWESLPDIGRNVNLNDEEEFVAYMLVQNPQVKTVLAAAAFFVYSAATCIMKNFVTGAKEIFIKKEAAKADYDLQDNLISVETSLFKGKNDIINSMMHSTAKELQSIIDKKTMPNSSTFKGQPKEKPEEKEQKSALSKKTKTLLAIGGTILGAIGITALSIKNIKNIDKTIKNNYDNLHKQTADILDKSSDEILKNNKETLKDIFSVMNFKPEKAEEVLKKAQLPEKERNEIISAVKERTKVFTQTPIEMGGRPGKIQYYTYVNDSRGHFYNWMMNITSKPLGILFATMASASALTYGGAQAIDAKRQIEVKKYNNETELNLHTRLVNVELRNFKSKKESAILPLIEEFKAQAPHKTKEELEDMAQHILYEIKNGAPFVYA